MHEPPSPTYCIIDIETDGPDPQRHSMLSLAVVVCTADGRERDAWTATLERRADADVDDATLAWWSTQPEAWAEATDDPRPPREVMRAFEARLRGHPAPRVFVAHPLLFDGSWVDAYLRRYGSALVFDPRGADPLFHGAGVDLASHVRAIFDLPWSVAPPAYPDDLRNAIPHDHTALNDARGHAALFFRSRQAARDPERRARLRSAMLAGPPYADS